MESNLHLFDSFGDRCAGNIAGHHCQPILWVGGGGKPGFAQCPFNQPLDEALGKADELVAILRERLNRNRIRTIERDNGPLAIWMKIG
jgi:hypothetical protein